MSSSVAWFFNNDRFVVGLSGNNDLIVLDTLHRHQTVLKCVTTDFTGARPFLGFLPIRPDRWAIFYQPKVVRGVSANLNSSIIALDFENRKWRVESTQTLIGDVVCHFANVNSSILTFKINNLNLTDYLEEKHHERYYELFVFDSTDEKCKRVGALHDLPVFDQIDPNAGFHVYDRILYFLHPHRKDYSRAISSIDMETQEQERLYTPPEPCEERAPDGKLLIDDQTLGSVVWSGRYFYALFVDGNDANRFDLKTGEWTTLSIPFLLTQPTYKSFPVFAGRQLTIHHRMRRDDGNFRIKTQRFELNEDKENQPNGTPDFKALTRDKTAKSDSLFKNMKVNLKDVNGQHQLFTRYQYAN